MEEYKTTTSFQSDGALQSESIAQSADGQPKNQLSASLQVGLGVLLLLGLFIISRYNFLLFHGIAELFSIAVAWSTFFLVLNIRREMRNDALLFLGIAFFYVGLVDLVHSLVYKDTGFVALDVAANYATQLWIAARSLEAVCLLIFPFLLTRRIQARPIVICLTSVTGLIFAVIFAWHLFPACYIEGTGLTLFKKATEYAICLILTATMVFLARQRKHMDAEVLQLMMWAIAFKIAGELAFTFYVSVYGMSNVAGHFFKIISFFFVYLALIRSSLARPYATLFRQLEQEKLEHRQHRELLDAVFSATPDLFALKDLHLKFQFANQAFCHFLGKTQEEIVGKSVYELFPHEEAAFSQQGDREVITTGHQINEDYSITGKAGKRWFHVNKTPVRNAKGTISGILSSITDVSARKKNESIMAARLSLLRTAESQSLAELLQVTLAECESITGSQVGFYHFLDTDQTTLSLQAWSTNTLATMCTAEGSGLHYPVSQAGVWVDCLKERAPVIHNDYASLPHRKGLPQGHALIIRELVVPVVRGEVIVAILGVGNKPTNYDDQDIEAVKFLADLAWDIAERKRVEEALRASENKFKTLAEASPSGIWQTDAKGNTTYVSTRWSEITGITPAAALGAGWSQGVHADDRDEVTRQWLESAQATEAFYESEFRFVRPDGEIIWVLCIARRVKDPAGSEKATWVGTITDISERKRIEVQLRESLQRYQLVLEGATGGIWDWDIPNKKVHFSSRWKAMRGYTDEEISDSESEWSDHIHPDDKQAVMAGVAANFAGESTVFEMDYRVRCKDGSWKWIQDRGRVIRDSTGKVIRMAGSEVDITERKRLENLLAFLAQTSANPAFGDFFRMLARYIAETLDMGFVCIDRLDGDHLTAHTEAVYSNGKFEDNVSYTLKDTPCGEVVGKHVCCFPSSIKKLFPDDAVLQHMEAESYLGVTLWSHDGRPIGLIAVIGARPLAGRAQAESLLKLVGVRAAAELERKLSEEERAKLQTQLNQFQKMEAVGQLAGGVAHDFNNMLGVITGYSEMILEQVDPNQRYYAEVEEILKAARRSADLTRQLLTFARKQVVAPQVLDLNQTIEGMFNMLRRLIGENIDLIWMPDTGLWPINMDPSQIDQILANLCVNARDAIAGVGKVTVETKNATVDKEYCAIHAGFLPGEYVRITVSDTGSGMDKETLTHIFEPFFTTKGLGEGTGLGLATVYGAVGQNNGFIDVSSEPGQGATFTIYIPRHVETTTETRATASAEPVVGGDECVLLVEDEAILLQMSKTMLERLGYTVLAEGIPSEAIRLAEEYPGQIHLLVTDVVMPEMNGRELSVRLLKSRPEMKCLFMSGYTANVIAKHGFLKKGLSFIQKPFSRNELALKVREAMEKN